ncbi:RecX family transcriptional regulator [Paenibacillus sp. FSL M8-0228]|uniref:Regulatory protein RecX n=1 Tax=Paenibacillus polymyxa TaxID=1406 RepID=A0A8I1LPT8_PAEPO|nr:MULTISPECIES: RecX family transcriptional regulator [Paenibacillus]KAF6574278.1 RecX family transcriptional regulator [Paenibacillus sp. EKM206P]KAF6588749.1 RecX family transcriptional regulator [Paenibacillus sp. EKM205P]MBM0632949.1 RecX family transcriptional regulator [Paenibacillus polymyxa]MBO3284381.1 RecX family transcriptional regulator [Paenibacillus polymyxa]MBP1308447.1 regulatory protein [Paenibacillus sp. 1182]
MQLDDEDEYSAEANKQQEISLFPDHEELMITRVEQGQGRKRGRYIIHFGPYSLSVLEDVMIKYNMFKGTSFVKKELEDIVLADEKQQAYVLALRYLGRKPRTRQEIAQRLVQKELDQSVIDEVMVRLEREQLVDDDLYARQWARQRITSQRKGKMWVRQELRQKGISKASIGEALGEITDNEEWESALTIGRKKWNQVRGDIMEKKRKTYPFLMRRGYSGDMTRRVVNHLTAAEHDAASDDEELLQWEE